MKLPSILLAGVALGRAGRLRRSPTILIGKGLTMYMQMGGHSGDGATLARETGAKQAAAAFGVDLKAQYLGLGPRTP